MTVEADGGHLWNRLVDEPAPAWEAFKAYRDMGLTRSVPKVAQQLEKPRGTLATYSAKYSWVMRCAAFDAEQDRLDLLELQAQRVKATREHLHRAQLLSDKMLKALESLDPEELTPTEILRFAVEATKMEREALKLNESTLNVNVSDTSVLSPEETELRLQALLAEVSRRLEAQNAPPTLLPGGLAPMEIEDAEVIDVEADPES